MVAAVITSFKEHSLLVVLSTVLVAFSALFPDLTTAWLSQIGLNESYRVRHMSIYYSRIFLSITVESKTFPTLIETQWPELYGPMHPFVFPNEVAHANGNHHDCSLIHQSIWSEVDSLSRLWVMDIGWQEPTVNAVATSLTPGNFCPPKLLAFDLLRNNIEILRIDCSKYIQPTDDKLLTVKLGPKFQPCQAERFVYFILPNDPYIMTYDTLEQKWQRHKLVSQKYTNVHDVLPIKPVDMTFGENGAELLISDTDGLLYSAPNSLLLPQTKFNDVKREEGSDESVHAIEHNAVEGDSLHSSIKLKLLGNLLGPSKGMMVDDLGGALFYTVAKFGAVVRCAPYKQNLTTIAYSSRKIIVSPLSDDESH